MFRKYLQEVFANKSSFELTMKKICLFCGSAGKRVFGSVMGKWHVHYEVKWWHDFVFFKDFFEKLANAEVCLEKQSKLGESGEEWVTNLVT